MVHKRKMNNKGFSLVEVIISMAILAIISIPLLNYFTDSMKYNAIAKTRQQATIEAQNIMEQLKAEDKLLKPDVTGNYITPYFSMKGIGYHDYNINNATGIGDVTYQCPAGTLSGQFDVKITLDSASTYNEEPLPVIYGIDETQDVLAVEKNQYTEAEAYFQAKSSSAGRVIDINANTTRTMHLDFKNDGGSGNINVKIYYVYQCLNLTSDGSVDTYTSTTLADVNLASVKNLYLLFNRKQDNEQVKIGNPDGITLPNMYFIWQSATADPGYGITIDGLSHLEKPKGIIHTDINNVYDEYGSSTAITKTTVATSEKPIRIVDIKIAVFPKGTVGGASAEAYVEIESTKGE